MPGKLLALCDVDKNHLDQRMNQVGGEAKGVKGYRDFREVLERKDIDVVHVATPPHWHALMAIAAAKSGKDVWCEKPMSRTIGEGIAIPHDNHPSAKAHELMAPWIADDLGLRAAAPAQ